MGGGGDDREKSLEIRLAEDPERLGSGRLQGVLMPYGERATDRPEMFEAGALYWPEGGVVLREQHNREAPIVRFTPEDRAGAVGVDIPLPDTQRGRDAAELVRNGTLRGLSVEFHAERERMAGGVRVIERAQLMGAGLVDSPSYSGAGVEVRDELEGGGYGCDDYA